MWVIGAICERTNKIKLCVLDDRRVATIARFLDVNIELDASIKTDRYRSYPRAVQLSGNLHEDVNHSEGFVNF